MKYFLPLLLIVAFQNRLCSQAYFTSAASGNWNNPASWSLLSGSSSTGYPVSGDSAIILGGHALQVSANAQCQSLTIKAASSLLLNASNTLAVSNNVLLTEASSVTVSAGAMTITGNLTVNQASTLLQNGGAISIIGLIFVTAPGTAGISLINADAGIFSCAGGMTITGTTATRIAQLSIGNGAANIIGALTTVTPNGKIQFTGTGALTLAGIVTSSNSSFNAGNGKVIYVGIPGSNQTIAPLIYNRLFITGAGNGSKTINGSVTVTDTLSLVSDTLTINGGGSLTLNNNATIVKTAGTILSAPIFLGQADLVYNNVQKDTTGLEMPSAVNTLRNLTVADIAGLTLASNVTLSNLLTLQNGELATNAFTLTINNSVGGVGSDPAINHINGYVTGKISRVIGSSTGTRIFPFGIAANQGYREYKIDYTSAPATGGTLTVQHYNTDAPMQSGLPLADGPVTLVNTAPYYWQADASGGLAGGTYNLSLTAEQASGVSDYTTLRIVKRPSSGGNWILDGIAGINTGTNTAPVVTRTGMSNFSQFTIAGSTSNTLPLILLGFTIQKTNNDCLLSWTTAAEINLAGFGIERSNDGIHFSAIGYQAAIGSSAVSNYYRFADAQAGKGVNYYRLKMIDRDGRFSYSKTIQLNTANNNPLRVWPTVVNSTLHIANSNGVLLLYDVNAVLVKTLVNGDNDLSRLPSGVYVLKTGHYTIRIVKY